MKGNSYNPKRHRYHAALLSRGRLVSRELHSPPPGKPAMPDVPPVLKRNKPG